MDTLCQTAPALPPPLPASSPLPPALPRTPGVTAAVGFIALYFLLQFAMGFVAALIVAVAVGIKAGLQHGLTGLAGLEARVQAALAQPDVHAMLTVVALAAAAAVILWQARRRWPQLWATAQPPGFGFVLPAVPAFFVVAIAVGIAAPVLGGMMTRLFAGQHVLHQDVQQLGVQAQPGSRVVLALLVVTLGPLVEELLFRGMLLAALMRRLRAGWAVIITSLSFVLIHLPGLQLQWYALPDLLLLALALCWIRLKSGSLWPAVLTHAVNNALAVTVWFVAIKPPG
ncbi:MAG TPA: type II CAAX endopeptidase family protein [Rhodanobacter sp.]